MVLGLDPALNNVGYCFLEAGGSVSVSTISAPKGMPQFEKMVAQAECLEKVLTHNHDKITHVGIEQPYVAGAGFRGGGGQQSANMWAVYSLMLYKIKQAKLPVVMFNITQFHSLIIRKKGITKLDIMQKATSEIHPPLTKPINEHEADAYFIAKHAQAFWNVIDHGRLGLETLTDDQRDIFTSRRAGSKGDLSGIIWRQSDFWFDFRQGRPESATTPFKELCLSLTH